MTNIRIIFIFTIRVEYPVFGRIIRPDFFLISGESGIWPDSKIRYPVNPYSRVQRSKIWVAGDNKFLMQTSVTLLGLV